MDLLEQRIFSKLGLKLTDKELKAVRFKYDKRERRHPHIPHRLTVHAGNVMEDMDSVVDKLRADLRKAEIPGYVEQSDTYHRLSLDQVFRVLRDKIVSRARTLGSSDSQIQEAVYLLSENRSPFLTREQLRFGVSIRLNIHLSDAQIHEIFERFDPEHSGVIKLMEFVRALLDDKGVNRSATIDLKSCGDASMGKSGRGVEPSITYDNKVRNLESSTVAPENRLTLEQIENTIRYKISERSFRGRNVQTLHKCFSDTRSGDAKATKHISRDQVKYTLFKRFQLRLSDEEIDLLFAKYDPEGRGKILIRRFVEGIIENEENANEPLIEEKYRGKTRIKPQALAEFLEFLRTKLRDLINREGRAPHYLIHIAGRMSPEGAARFLLDKFAVDIDSETLQEIAKFYVSSGLIDMKLLLLDVMTVESQTVMGPEKSLVDGCLVCVDELPASLRATRLSPAQIEDILRRKLSERMKNEHPMSSVHKMFRNTDVVDTRFVSAEGMLQLFNRFDVFMRKEDFKRFFDSHDQGDGRIDTRKLMQYLLPPADYRENPFTPKSTAEHRAEVKVAKKMHLTIGGGARVTDELNGPSFARLNEQVLSAVLDAEEVPEQRSPTGATHADIGLKSRVKPQEAYNKALYSLDAETHREVTRYTPRAASSVAPAMCVPASEAPEQPSPRHQHFALSLLGRASGDSCDDDADSHGLTVATSFAPTHSRPGTASPRTRKTQESSPRAAVYVYTGQRRSPGINPLSEFLAKKYAVSLKSATLSSNSYGIYFKDFQRQKSKSARIESRRAADFFARPPPGASGVAMSPRVSHVSDRTPVSIEMKLANSFR